MHLLSDHLPLLLRTNEPRKGKALSAKVFSARSLNFSSVDLSSAPFFNRLQDFRDRLGFWFRAQIAFAVDADAYCIGFHVALSDYEHGVDFHLFGALDLRGIEIKLPSQISRFSSTLQLLWRMVTLS